MRRYHEQTSQHESRTSPAPCLLQDPRHSIGTHRIEGFVLMADNHLYVSSVDDQKDKMRTIPRHVQQYQTSVTIVLVKYYGLLYQMRAERFNSSNITEHLLSMDRKISS